MASSSRSHHRPFRFQFWKVSYTLHQPNSMGLKSRRPAGEHSRCRRGHSNMPIKTGGLKDGLGNNNTQSKLFRLLCVNLNDVKTIANNNGINQVLDILIGRWDFKICIFLIHRDLYRTELDLTCDWTRGWSDVAQAASSLAW
jgi:hypothetical protein